MFKKICYNGDPLYFVFIIIVFFSLDYYPGLHGSFLFDDIANLHKLGEFNGVRNFDTFIKFVGNGIAGPTGRPLSLLSFLLNGTNWPTDPFPFKVTNVVLHGLNGYFLFLLCRLVFIGVNLKPEQAFIAALVATSFWLLHPFLVSTVLYVVQRMAMLSAFFSIVGLWLYTKGRLQLADDLKRGYITMSLGLSIGTLLAILSKENGVLLPLLAVCVEYCVFRQANAITKPLNRYWAFVFLILPSVLVFALLIKEINPYTLTHPFNNRNFNLPERLLTESRIVTEYLYYLIIPRLSYPGILNENSIISKGLWNPPQTAFCVLFIITLLTAALRLRKRYPLVALGILFFFAGHVLESTTLSLELYFEHRNYLPAIFLFMPVGYFFVTQHSRLAKGCVLAMLVIWSLFTYQLSTLWGNELALTLFWAKQNPTSSRAQRTAAQAFENKGDNLAALQLLNQAKIVIPDSLDLQWHWLMLACYTNTVSSDDFAKIKQVSSVVPFTPYHFNILQATIEMLNNNGCKGLNSTNALELLDIMLVNPGIKNDQRLLFQPHHLKGFVFATHNKPKEALAEYATVLQLTQNIEHGLVQVGVLASYGFYPEALQHLTDIETILNQQPNVPSGIFSAKLNYHTELARIKKNLLADIKNQHRIHD